MGRIFEKRLRLRRRNGTDVIYPETLASLVKTKDGKTVEEAMAGIAESIPEGYSLVGAVASGDSTELDFVDKGAYILGAGTYTIGESSEEVEEGYIGIALMATMANDTNTVSLIQIAVGSSGGSSSGGGGLYESPLTLIISQDAFEYSLSDDFDLDALRSCTAIKIAMDMTAVQPGMTATFSYGLTLGMMQSMSGQTQEAFGFGDYESQPNDAPLGIALQFANGVLAGVRTAGATISPAEVPGDDPEVV